MRAILAAAAATLLAAGVALAAQPWTVVAAFDANLQLPLAFAGRGIAIAPDGTGAIAWQANADVETSMVATFSPTAPPRRLHIRLPDGADAVAALGGGRAAIGALGLDVGSPFELEVVGPGRRASAPLIPGAAQHLQSRPAVMASNAAGELAVFGASGARPVLTICTAAGCGRTEGLGASTGALDVDDGGALAVALGADGWTVAAWVENGAVEARWRAPGGRLGPTQRLGRVRTYVWLAAAVSAGGRAALVWESQDDRHPVRPGPATSATVALGATAPTAGAAFSAPVTLGRYPANRSIVPRANGALPTASTVVAAAFDGARPLAAWTGHDAHGFTVHAADLDAPAATEQTVSPAGESATLGALASTPAAGSIVAWEAPALGEVQVAQAPAGEPFGAPRSLPGGVYTGAYGASAVAALDPATGHPWVGGIGGQGLVVLSGTPAR